MANPPIPASGRRDVAAPPGGAGSHLAWDADGANRVVESLQADEVVLLPTDTVYGLAVRADSPQAVARLAGLKGRDAHKPVAVLVASIEQAHQLAELDDRAQRLVRACWPGALTVIVRRREVIDWNLGGDPSTIGLRCPADALLRSVISRVGAIAATSANLAGDPPVTLPSDSKALLEAVSVAIDAGRREGPASTVVDLTAPGLQPVVLRGGPVSLAHISAVLE